MKAPAGVANPLDELPLDEAVHILVWPVDECRVASAFLEDRLETALDRRGVLPRQHARRAERLCPREAAGDIVFKQRAIECKRDPEIERGGIGLGVETAGPECHEWRAETMRCCPLKSSRQTVAAAARRAASPSATCAAWKITAAGASRWVPDAASVTRPTPWMLAIVVTLSTSSLSVIGIPFTEIGSPALNVSSRCAGASGSRRASWP